MSALLRGSRAYPAAKTTEYLYNQLIPYIGNKRNLLDLIRQAIERTGVQSGTFADLFAGSGVVSRFSKTLGYKVIANDWEPYAQAINSCYIGSNRMPEFRAFGGAEEAFRRLNCLEPIEGWVTTHLCPANDASPDPETERMFYTRANGMRIDAIREALCSWLDEGRIDHEEFNICLAALLYSACYTSNTSGVFKGFHRGWGGATGTALYRILSDLELRLPVLRDNGQENLVFRSDAQTLAEQLRADAEPMDIAYIDPPYNQHPYGSNYHILNSIALWDKPDIPRHITPGTKSAIRTDWRTERRSAYNHSATALEAYTRLLHTLDARWVLTSYSTDGNIPLEDMLKVSSERGALECVVRPYKRYRVSSQRMSAKPMNAEFVLIINCSAPPDSTAAARIFERIMHSESAALASHPEMASPEPPLPGLSEIPRVV